MLRLKDSVRTLIGVAVLVMLISLSFTAVKLADSESGSNEFSHYFRAVQGYYYIVQGSWKAYYYNNNEIREIPVYRWDVNVSYTIFQSPATGIVYLKTYTGHLPVLQTVDWFRTDAVGFDPAVNITIVFPYPWETVVNRKLNPSVSIEAYVRYNGSVAVANTTRLTYRGSIVETASTTMPVYSGENYDAVVIVKAYEPVFFIATPQGYSTNSVQWNNVWYVESTGYYYHKYTFLAYTVVNGYANSTVTVRASTGITGFESIWAGINYYSVNITIPEHVSTFTKTMVYHPDAEGRITCSNGNIIVDATDRLFQTSWDYLGVFYSDLGDYVEASYRVLMTEKTIEFEIIHSSGAKPSGTLYINDGSEQYAVPIANGYGNYVFSDQLGNVSVSYIDVNGVDYRQAEEPIIVYKEGSDAVLISSTSPVENLSMRLLQGYFTVSFTSKGQILISQNTGLPVFAVVINETPWSFNVSDQTVFFTAPENSNITVHFVQTMEATIRPGSSPTGGSFIIGYASAPDNNADLVVGIFIEGAVVKPVLYYNGTWSYGTAVYGFAYPLFTAVKWSRGSETVSISYMVAYYLGNHTYYVTGYWEWRNVSCPETLYPTAMVVSNEGKIDRFGLVSSEILDYLGRGSASFTGAGAFPAGGFVKYIVLNTPIKIVNTGNDVIAEPGGSTGITLVGFKGYMLSYSVSYATVSGLVVTSDEQVVEIPVGTAVIVFVDPASKTINIVQTSPPTLHTTVVPRTDTPFITLPEPTARNLPVNWDSSMLVILYGSAVAVAIIIAKATDSIPQGIMVASAVYGLVAFGIGVYTGDSTAVASAVLAFTIAGAVEIARRISS